MEVITYQFAYVPGEIDLCEMHGAAPPDSLPALGPVAHGAHEGVCGACERRDDEDDEGARPTLRDLAAQGRLSLASLIPGLAEAYRERQGRDDEDDEDAEDPQ